MKKKEAIVAVLEKLCETHESVWVHLDRMRLKGSVSKSRDNYYLGTSKSLFRIIPSEVAFIKNPQGERILP